MHLINWKRLGGLITGDCVILFLFLPHLKLCLYIMKVNYWSKLWCVKPHHKLMLSSPCMPRSKVRERPEKKRAATVTNNPYASVLLLVMWSLISDFKGQRQMEEGKTLDSLRQYPLLLTPVSCHNRSLSGESGPIGLLQRVWFSSSLVPV